MRVRWRAERLGCFGSRAPLYGAAPCLVGHGVQKRAERGRQVHLRAQAGIVRPCARCAGTGKTCARLSRQVAVEPVSDCGEEEDDAAGGAGPRHRQEVHCGGAGEQARERCARGGRGATKARRPGRSRRKTTRLPAAQAPPPRAPASAASAASAARAPRPQTWPRGRSVQRQPHPPLPPRLRRLESPQRRTPEQPRAPRWRRGASASASRQARRAARPALQPRAQRLRRPWLARRRLVP